MPQYTISHRFCSCLQQRYMLFLVVVFCSSFVHARHVIHIEKSNKALIEEREAIVILTGFGSIYHSAKNQVKNFKNKGFDLFIPDYISRNSLADCSQGLARFIDKYKLKNYKKIHVFSYIIGGWTLNSYLKTHEWKNLSSIVYDRSPLQETLPGILSRENPFLSRMLFGKLIKELAVVPYPPSDQKNCKVGLLIETKATKILYKKKASFLQLQAVSYNLIDFHQSYTDYFYTYQSHDDLYVALEYPAPLILSFFKTGFFGDAALRDYQQRNPFETYEKK